MRTIAISALCATLSLASCSTTKTPHASALDDGPRPSFGAGLVAGVAEAESGLDGPTFGGRLDVSFPVAGPHLELGVRGSFGYALFEPDAQPLPVDLELEAFQVALAPLARVWFTDDEAPVRPYAEGFVGHHWTELEATASGFGLVASESDNDSGLFFGFGGGLGIPFDDQSLFVIGVEWTRSDFSDLEAEVDAIMGHVGVRVSF